MFAITLHAIKYPLRPNVLSLKYSIVLKSYELFTQNNYTAIFRQYIKSSNFVRKTLICKMSSTRGTVQICLKRPTIKSPFRMRQTVVRFDIVYHHNRFAD